MGTAPRQTPINAFQVRESVLARDAERPILQLLIIGLALVLAGIAAQYAIGLMMSPAGARGMLIVLSGSGVLLMLAAGFLTWFYRDPERQGSGGLLCPADGKVIIVDEQDDPDLGPSRRIAIFMSPLDVHVNRVPTGARLEESRHHPGGYLPAFRKESERNERFVTLWRATGENEDGLGKDERFKLVQIAGTLARRIVPYVEAGATLKAGERYGIIKLGSRVDIYLPMHVEPTVRPGARVKAGKSVIARPGTPPAPMADKQKQALPAASAQ